MSGRKSWAQYYMDIARVVSTRATCPRKHVGCILVREKHLIASGYNGSVSGLQHCTDIGCMMEDDHCVRTTHAEVNAVAQAARHGARTDGSTAYVTASPCWHCFKVLATAGVEHIVFGEFYRDDRLFDAAAKAHITLRILSGDGECKYLVKNGVVLPVEP